MLWVVRDAMTSEESIDGLIDFSKKNNFKHLLVQVRGRGDSYYNSKFVPKSHLLKSKFDPLNYILESVKGTDIKIHAWINVYYIWSTSTLPKQSNHLLFKHPNWLDSKSNNYISPEQIRNRKKIEGEGYYLSPTNYNVKNHIKKIIQELINSYDIDGIHYDYIRYHDFEYGFNPLGVKAFKDKYSINKYINKKEIIKNPKWGDFRRSNITQLVAELNSLIKAKDPNCIISAAVKPNIYEAKLRFGQEWDLWLSSGYINWAIPMNYSKENNIFISNINIIKDNIPQVYLENIIMGIATYNQSAKEAGQKVIISRNLNFTNLSIFSYNSFINKKGYWRKLKHYLK
tara:strand:+ start:921 stop:1949 length:1029 start_codon:yes stop_codon:yes gene_type:complete